MAGARLGRLAVLSCGESKKINGDHLPMTVRRAFT
jgi:hypothetical protein